MEAFESIVAGLLEQEGYWVRLSYKVSLTKAEKVSIGKPSCPRWDIDLIAYKPGADEILAVECKSYLDSPGVRFARLARSSAKGAERFKLFNVPKLRRVVFKALKRQLASNGGCSSTARVKLCLAAGNIYSQEDHAKLKQHFDKKGWLLLDRNWFRERFREAADSSYENNIAVMVAKLLDPARLAELTLASGSASANSKKAYGHRQPVS